MKGDWMFVETKTNGTPKGPIWASLKLILTSKRYQNAKNSYFYVSSCANRTSTANAPKLSRLTA